jgi:hypothetical protein
MAITLDRVRAHTDREINERIDAEAAKRVVRSIHLSGPELSRRIAEVDRKWDIERYLELNASTLALVGVILVTKAGRRWLLMPGIILMFLLKHAVQGWCPPMEIFRRLGVRTRREIDSEKYALKALRGDFRDLSWRGDGSRIWRKCSLLWESMS